MQGSLFDSVATYRDGTLSGRRNLEASRDAASVVDRTLNERQLAVLNALVKAPRTADEVSAALNRKIGSIAPRFTELKARGFIVPTGERRTTSDGCTAHVYRLSTSGARYLRVG
jgi:DNA-binding PadR family transcriptional regulator